MLKSFARNHGAKFAVLAAVPLGIYWMLAAQMSWRPRILFEIGDWDDSVLALSWSQDGERIAVIGSDPSLSLWTSDGNMVRNIGKIGNGAVLLRDEETFGGAYHSVMPTHDYGNKLELRDARTGRHRQTWNLGHAVSNDGMALSRSGKMLAAHDPERATRIYDLSRITEGRPLLVHKLTDKQWSSGLAFSPDGRTLAITNWRGDGTKVIFEIRLRDTQTWKLQRTFKNDSEGIHSLSFSPDGDVLACFTERRTVLWNPHNGKLLHSLATGPVKGSFSPDGKILASPSYGPSIKLWDVRTGALLRELKGQRFGVNTIAFSPDGAFLISGSFEGVVRQWRIK